MGEMEAPLSASEDFECEALEVWTFEVSVSLGGVGSAS